MFGQHDVVASCVGQVTDLLHCVITRTGASYTDYLLCKVAHWDFAAFNQYCFILPSCHDAPPLPTYLKTNKPLAAEATEDAGTTIENIAEITERRNSGHTGALTEAEAEARRARASGRGRAETGIATAGTATTTTDAAMILETEKTAHQRGAGARARANETGAAVPQRTDDPPPHGPRVRTRRARARARGPTRARRRQKTRARRKTRRSRTSARQGCWPLPRTLSRKRTVPRRC